MKRKWIKILAAAMCVMMAVPMIGSAAPLELNKEDCSLTVKFPEKNTENGDMIDDLATAGVVYDLYKVAVMVDDGGYYTYKITDEFKELLSDQDLLAKYGGEAKSLVDAKGNLRVPRDENGSNHDLWEDMAQKAALIALNPVKAGARAEGDSGDDGSDTEEAGSLTGSGLPMVGEIVGTEKPGLRADEFIKKSLVLENKSVETEIPDLNTGLYLLIARGTSAGESYITRVKTAVSGTDSTSNTSGQIEKIVTVAYTNQHIYTFAPQLVSIPTKEPDVNGVVSTANSGDWVYNPTVYLKPEQHTRYGYLEIVKDLKTHASFAGQAGEAVFVFQVEAELNGQSVYSDVKTLIFTAAGMDSVVIDKIPVGAKVKIKEVYSGASYTLEAMGQGRYAEGVKPNGGVSDIYTSVKNIAAREVTDIIIEANRVASVKFTNDYDHRQTSGHGVINSYEYNEGWANRAEQEFTNPNQPQNNSQQENNNP